MYRIPGVTAVIFSQLNLGSVRVVEKLGLRVVGAMPFDEFLSDTDLADEVVEYEIWRLAHDPQNNVDGLLHQTAFRAGQLSTVTSHDAAQILESLMRSLEIRHAEPDTFRNRLQEAFESGRNEAFMDCYHVSREDWQRA